MTESIIRFGLPDEWQSFARRNQTFLERFEILRAAIDETFVRSWSSDHPIDGVVFSLGRQCVDDFMEILLLCGNSEGYGAQKILRAMFERIVLLRYLKVHPDKLEDYLDYFWVSQNKLINRIQQSDIGKLDAVKVAEIRANYERVKERYKTRVCKECGAVAMGIAWTPMTLPDMANEVGLGEFVLYAYDLPLSQTHPNVKGMLDRLASAGHGIEYGVRLNRDLADKVLFTAHGLLLHVLDVQAEHFGLTIQMDTLLDQFAATWRTQGGQSK